jgi:hypothetical protein
MTTPSDSTRWTSQTVSMGADILDRMEQAVQKVRERLLRATSALNEVNVPYAVVGGNAVASWVATVDEGTVRNTPNVDIMIRRNDQPIVTGAMQTAGFVADEAHGFVIFREGCEGKPREAVRLLFSGEKRQPDELLPMPGIATVDDPAGFRVIRLELLLEPGAAFCSFLDRGVQEGLRFYGGGLLLASRNLPPIQGSQVLGKARAVHSKSHITPASGADGGLRQVAAGAGLVPKLLGEIQVLLSDPIANPEQYSR